MRVTFHWFSVEVGKHRSLGGQWTKTLLERGWWAEGARSPGRGRQGRLVHVLTGHENNCLCSLSSHFLWGRAMWWEREVSPRCLYIGAQRDRGRRISNGNGCMCVHLAKMPHPEISYWAPSCLIALAIGVVHSSFMFKLIFWKKISKVGIRDLNVSPFSRDRLFVVWLTCLSGF